MHFGQLFLFETPTGRTDKDIVDEQVELMVRAEEFGFDSVWSAEHHFSEYGYCATPAVTLAAVAAQTKRIRLCTGVVVLPLNHPIRVAEDYAFLDNLSDGRIELGIGRGYQPIEFEGYNVDAGRSRAIFHESAEVIRRAWTEDRFDFDGEFFQIRDLSVRPRPLQRPHPPIWMASLSDETFDLCGRYGYHLLCAPVFGFDIDAGVAQIERYRQALTEAGHAAEDHKIAALTITYVAETTQQAREDLRDSVLWYYRTLARYIAPPKGQGTLPSYESYGAARDFLESVDWETVLERGAVVCGSPSEVADRIADIRERCGFTHYLGWTRIGGLAKSKVLRSNQLMAERVMPLLR
jgi:natural product biosynthesis luciferase-like monooxygenase protein